VIDLPFSRPTLTQICDRIKTDMETRIIGVGSLLRRSTLKVLSKVYGGAIHLCYGFLKYMGDQLFILTADENYLIIHGTEYGLNKEVAVKATGSISISGTADTVIPAATKIKSTSGYVYLTDESVTVKADGLVGANITAEVAGEDSNEDAGTILSFISPIVNIDTSVTVEMGGITGGLDAETVEEFRTRLLTRKRQPSHGGSANDYVTWTKEVSGVTRAWCLPAYNGIGTVGVAFTRDNDNSIVPNATQREIVEEYIIEHEDPASGEIIGIPVGCQTGLTIIELETQSIDFIISVFPNTTIIQTAIEAELEDLLYREGGPGETIYLSEINEAICSAQYNFNHVIVTPIVDITSSNTQVPVLGDVLFRDL